MLSASKCLLRLGTLAVVLGAASCTRPSDRPARTSAPVGPAASTAAESVRLSAPSAKPEVPLVVAIVVDQLAAWLALERLSTLPSDGGFARLLREGSYVQDMRYLHAVTDTAPGHAALFSGAPPRESGAFANGKLLPDSGAKASLVADPNVHLVTSKGVEAGPGVSLAALQVDTIADRLRAIQPEALIVSLSVKDRGAVFGGGRAPTASLWFDSTLGVFVTSTAFAPTLPEWAMPAAESALAQQTQLPWSVARPVWLMQQSTTSDDAEGEGIIAGLTRAFPHDARSANLQELAFRVSPAGDRAVLDLAVAALQALPFGTQPGLLSLSLSSTDYVGHIYGPDSWEWWDNWQRLDDQLARLFDALDKKVGAEHYSVVLTGDHGIGVMPETLGNPKARRWCNSPVRDRFERPCAQGGRVFSSALLPIVEAKAAATLGPGAWVQGVSEPYVYLTQAALQLQPTELDRLLRALAGELQKQPGIQAAYLNPAAYRGKSQPAPCPPPSDESVDALVCRSLNSAAGAVYLVTKPGWYLDLGYTPGEGANHGSPRLHDRSVPLLVRAPGHVAAGQVLDAPLSYATFTHTVSALLGIPSPHAAYPAVSLAN